MATKIFLFIVTSLSFRSVENTCSSEIGIQLLLDLPEERLIQEQRKLIQGTVTKFTLDSTAPIFRLTMSTLYCPPVEVALFSPCNNSVTILEPIVGEDKIYNAAEKSCWTPSNCDEGACDGITQQECNEYTRSSLQKANTRRSPNLSSSWIHHRCIRTTDCEIEPESPKLLVQGKNSQVLFHHNLGVCQLNNISGTCCWENGFCTYATVKSTVQDLPKWFICLEKDRETFCMEKDSREVIRMIDSETGVLGDELIEIQWESVHYRRGPKKVMYGAIADKESVEEVWEALEYSILQADLNDAIIDQRTRDLESMITTIFTEGSHPLQSFIKKRYGVSTSIKNITDESIFLYVCATISEKGPPYLNLIKWEKVSLHNTTGLNALFTNHPAILSYKYRVTPPNPKYLNSSPAQSAHEYEKQSFYSGISIENLISWFVLFTCIVFWVKK
uniref:Uncharacterized protein n=1 Tax=Astopletus virus TaxID=2800905 RepID=A0A894KN16_9VIRU|nr:MAG: hypothetical protein [Astopletus virus]QRW42571.1 MAG: hypothetical protein [Astopletus virus]